MAESRVGWLTPRRKALGLLIASAVGYAIAIDAVVIIFLTERDRIFDSTLYWQAARSVLDGTSPYGAIEIGTTLKAFFYPPIFAQLCAPLALLPEPVFTWGWRTMSFGCVVWLAGGWRNAGLWLLFPLMLNELANPNVTLPAAVVSIIALRGRPWLLPLAGMLKFGPLLLVPYIWLRRPAARRPLLIACAATAALCLTSFALAPNTWFEYIAQMRAQSGITTADTVAILPSAGADFALRVGLGIALVAAGLFLRSDRLAFIGSTIVVPAFWWTRLLPLIGLPRLPGRERKPSETHVPASQLPAGQAVEL